MKYIIITIALFIAGCSAHDPVYAQVKSYTDANPRVKVAPIDSTFIHQRLIAIKPDGGVYMVKLLDSASHGWVVGEEILLIPASK